MIHAALALVTDLLAPILATWPRRFVFTAAILGAIWLLVLVTR